MFSTDYSSRFNKCIKKICILQHVFLTLTDLLEIYFFNIKFSCDRYKWVVVKCDKVRCMSLMSIFRNNILMEFMLFQQRLAINDKHTSLAHGHLSGRRVGSESVVVKLPLEVPKQ